MNVHYLFCMREVLSPVIISLFLVQSNQCVVVEFVHVLFLPKYIS